jgi:hypothetical protein
MFQKWLPFIFIAGLIIFGPMSVVFALNTMFKLDIVFNIDSWCAVVILYSVFKFHVEVRGEN